MFHIVLLLLLLSPWRCFYSSLVAIEPKRMSIPSSHLPFRHSAKRRLCFCECVESTNAIDGRTNWQQSKMRCNHVTAAANADADVAAAVAAAMWLWIQFLFVCAQKSNWIFDLDWHRFSVGNAMECIYMSCLSCNTCSRTCTISPFCPVCRVSFIPIFKSFMPTSIFPFDFLVLHGDVAKEKKNTVENEYFVFETFFVFRIRYRHLRLGRKLSAAPAVLYTFFFTVSTSTTYWWSEWIFSSVNERNGKDKFKYLQIEKKNRCQKCSESKLIWT